MSAECKLNIEGVRVIRQTCKGDWICRCSCGRLFEVSGSVESGNRQSCGCCHEVNLVGIRFGDLIVVGMRVNAKRQTEYICRCQCNQVAEFTLKDLKERKVKDCGCGNFKPQYARSMTGFQLSGAIRLG